MERSGRDEEGPWPGGVVLVTTPLGGAVPPVRSAPVGGWALWCFAWVGTAECVSVTLLQEFLHCGLADDGGGCKVVRTPSCIRSGPTQLVECRPEETNLRETIVPWWRRSCVQFDTIERDPALEPYTPDVGGGAVDNIDHLGGRVERPVTPEENDVGPHCRMPELLLRHKFHHLLDGDVLVQAIGGETVRPPVLGVGVLVVLDLGALLVVKVE